MKILITGGNGNIAKMINNKLSLKYEITAPGRDILNVLLFNNVKEYLENNSFDILIHTAIQGGRRTKDENGDVTHNNLLMLENILKFAHKFKMIINMDSGAIYDRSTNILNRSEDELLTVPSDYYGFSKYLIYQRSLQYDNFYNFRIFNIFHEKEEKDRFIKACFLAKKYKTEVNIFEDKFFDFMYEDDFIKIINYYLENYQNNLPKTLNLCYNEKYKLSQIAELIFGCKSDKIIIGKNDSLNNYCGKNDILRSFNIPLLGLEKSLEKYRENMEI